MRKFYSCLMLLVSVFAMNAQDKNSPESAAIAGYFSFDREAIHIQTNKAIYQAGEKIWFKGYVLKKQTHQPFTRTTNVHVSLIDQSGQKVSTVLLYAENSIFEGYVPLPKVLPSGAYYLQAFTQYMNNFSEDESSVYPISILNPGSTEFFDNYNIDYSALDISFFPESGIFLSGNSNTIAMRIADCSGNGVPSIDAAIWSPAGKQIASVTTDLSGYARFDIPNTEMGIYKLKTAIKGKEYVKALPMPQASGIAFSINNYVFADKAVVSVKTNQATIAQIKGRTYNFVVQQYDASATAAIVFDGTQTTQTLTMPANIFSEGLNTVYLIDDGKNSIAERLVYQGSQKTVAPSQLNIVRKRGDSIVIGGLSGLKMANLSISVLPASAPDTKNDMYSRTLLSSLKDNLKTDGRRYFSDLNRKKRYELDNMLMAQTSKYSWKNITGEAPVAKFAFDNGVVIKGTVNNASVNRLTAKVNLNSISYGIDEYSKLNEKNEFAFEHVVVEDSSTIFVSLFDKNNQRTDIHLAAQVSGNNRSFIKSFEPVAKSCILKPIVWEAGFPNIRGTIKLDSVVVKSGPAKPKLNEANAMRYSNSGARGYKISPSDVGMYSTVVDFIASHGFNVTQNPGSVSILQRGHTSFGGVASPLIFIDDSPQDDFNLLTMYTMDQVDEIYVSKHGYGGGSGASAGTIRIYLKKGHIGGKIRLFSKGLVVKGGFQKWKTYKNPYSNFSGPGFAHLGEIAWIPNVDTDASGNFRFAFPDLYQESVKVIIEGIATDGTVTSEVHTLQLK